MAVTFDVEARLTGLEPTLCAAVTVRAIVAV
jgi:hypothetical protein